jgi:predicted house-cleaning noncanonical NTP pyrophosphatase (MazG superfamily)
MENKSLSKQGSEKAHAHRLETPQPMIQVLRESAEKIGESLDNKQLVLNLVDFKLNVVNLMNHFNISFSQVEPFTEDKKREKGGFGKRAYQEHYFLGVNGIKLVRDKLSDGKFLPLQDVDLYLSLLDKKIMEETKELTEAMGNMARIEEFGDVFEVFNAILSARGINENLIEHKRQTREIELRRERRKLKSRK